MDMLIEKNKIKDRIDKLDDITLLTTIDDIINFNLAKNYTLEPLSKSDLIQRAIESEEAIKNNDVVNIEDLEKEMKML
jgi:hypothetical protein